MAGAPGSMLRASSLQELGVGAAAAGNDGRQGGALRAAARVVGRSSIPIEEEATVAPTDNNVGQAQ
jgi:hypothetical protein